MLEKFVLSVLVAASKNPDVRDFVADQVERLVDKLKADLLPDIVGTFPGFGAGLLKAVFEKLPNVADLPGDVADLAGEAVQQLLNSDPDIPGLSSIIDLSGLARVWLGR